MRWSDVADATHALYCWCDERSGGALGILKRAWLRFQAAQAGQAAAGMAYYAIFSLFPLLLFLVAAGSFFLGGEQAREAVVGLVTRVIPVSHELIRRNVQQVLKLRGQVGLIGLIGLLWSGSGFFTTLAHQVDRAWCGPGARALLQQRLVALVMVAVLAALLFLALLSNTVASLLPRLQIPLFGDLSVYETALWRILSNLLPRLFTFLMYFSLYRWVPRHPVMWPAAFWGALVAALGWEAATRGFAWYLASGLAHYDLVYGSLGAVVVLMFWIYLVSWITLFGAHLSAAIARRPAALLVS